MILLCTLSLPVCSRHSNMYHLTIAYRIQPRHYVRLNWFLPERGWNLWLNQWMIDPPVVQSVSKLGYCISMVPVLNRGETSFPNREVSRIAVGGGYVGVPKNPCTVPVEATSEFEGPWTCTMHVLHGCREVLAQGIPKKFHFVEATFCILVVY